MALWTALCLGGLADDALAHQLTNPTESTVSWSSCGAGAAYDVVKGNLVTLRTGGGNFQPSVLTCLVNDSPSTSASDPAVAAPGQGFYYLVRGSSPCANAGSYDEIASSQVAPRDAGIAGSGAACP